MEKGDGGKEGDWECSGCKNRNYAFRSFCNRCKQPRLLVDTKTPSDSKWLPRIGDWICTGAFRGILNFLLFVYVYTVWNGRVGVRILGFLSSLWLLYWDGYCIAMDQIGCTNNNYASRDKCKKCGQPKEVAAMAAIALPGASLPTYSNYFSRAGGWEQKMSMGLVGTSGPHQLLPLNNFPVGGADKYGIQGPLAGNFNYGLPNENSVKSVANGWRNGDWICTCGFHNYSSRQQCKKCNAVPSALGTKRLASEVLAHEWDNKRLNLGPQSSSNFERVLGTNLEPNRGLCTYPGISSSASLNLPVPMPFLPPVNTPALLGKGAKQWRNGDWMCTNCNNHNYASRLQCNRCKTPRVSPNLSVNVM